MAKSVTLSTQVAAEASPYKYTFKTRSDLDNRVVARANIGTSTREFSGVDLTAVLALLSSYESYRTDIGKSNH